MRGYFDHAATTMTDETVAKAVYDAMLQYGGNPSSGHRCGMEAGTALRQARKRIAACVGADENEIFFTSGGTEGNNLLLQGAAAKMQKCAPEILYSETEHASVTETVSALQTRGSVPVVLPAGVNASGDVNAFLAAMTEKTGLVTMMKINNETGAVNAVEQLAKKAHDRNPEVFVHTDLVSALGKCPLSLHEMHVDLATFSAHKIRGPKGVGFVYIKSGRHLRPLLFGGEQQSRVRPGTENLPGILGLALALEKAAKALAENQRHARECKLAVLNRLAARESITIHKSENDSPFLLNLSTNTVKSETMLNALSEKGFYISAGSACAKGAKSHVLTAMGLSQTAADTALRLSFGPENTVTEAVALADAILAAEETLCHAYAARR